LQIGIADCEQKIIISKDLDMFALPLRGPAIVFVITKVAVAPDSVQNIDFGLGFSCAPRDPRGIKDSRAWGNAIQQI
jgi:hypothetical protein